MMYQLLAAILELLGSPSMLGGQAGESEIGSYVDPDG